MALTLSGKRLRISMNLGEETGKKVLRSRTFSNINTGATDTQYYAACEALAALLNGTSEQFSLISEEVLSQG
ncbi:MAG: DUF1659 domain-containing protein [Clostridia bacterium]|nr:DUF1659 domain-containing protein [Clostridiales bacterium]MDU7243905.1 DUF1659 domain-containing protein [Clostridiales bacterium]MDU7505213.1 DUF1659 domain-containing protein [Clostridia bacterium]